MESAEWFLQKQPRESWIAPVADHPIHENLYDRFYAMMMDMAITEHLSFAYALSGEARFGEAARAWTVSCARAWREDADAAPDGGKAYAVMRLIKGTAVGYDLIHDLLSEEERVEIRDMIARTADTYYQHYFSLPDKAGPGFHTHHAVVECSSFGVAALALLDEAPEAQEWLDATVRKFEEHLLPAGLAPDGAQVEGATFWASTMHYRLFFMDALRRVTGTDLFGAYASFMNADLALASIAGKKAPGWNEPHQSVVFSPPYGQLDYYAPVLVFLAREYWRPVFQYLAAWDGSLGGVQQTRCITPNRREQLLFELGGYACLSYDPSVAPEADDAPLSYAFPSVSQVYARASWAPEGLLVALERGEAAVVHAGGAPVIVAPGLVEESDAVPSSPHCTVPTGSCSNGKVFQPNGLSGACGLPRLKPVASCLKGESVSRSPEAASLASIPRAMRQRMPWATANCASSTPRPGSTPLFRWRRTKTGSLPLTSPWSAWTAFCSRSVAGASSPALGGR